MVVVNSYMVSAAQSARRIVVNSRPSPDGGSREAPGSTFPHGLPREAGGRQKRLLGAQVGLRNSRPPASTCGHSRLDGAPSGTRLGTQIPIEDSNCNRIRSLDGRRPGLRVLCSSPRTEDESPASMMDGRRTTSLCRQQSMAILPFRNSSEDPATADIAERSAREHSLAGAR